MIKIRRVKDEDASSSGAEPPVKKTRRATSSQSLDHVMLGIYCFKLYL